MKTLFWLVSIILLSLDWSSAQNPVQVTTSQGTVEGYIGDGVINFLGIPYAKASSRFSLPQPYSWNDVLPVKQYGKVCPQANVASTDMSEDCLFLNIMTPLNVINITQSLPVMFWIHGGSFLSGAGSLYNGTYYVEKNIIVVTINYRLGALGYFSSLEIWEENPASPTLGGMNGLFDQLAALTWVNQNIAAFGGDPSRITIVGESAGGLSVCSLAASPLSEGLFTNIIIQSGSCTGPWGPNEAVAGLVQSQLFLQSLNSTTLDELRGLPLLRLMNSPYWHIFPSVDDNLLPMHPYKIYQEGNSQIPSNGHIIVSTNTLDTLFGFPFYDGPFPEDNPSLLAVLSQFFGPDDAPKIFNIYPGTPSPKVAFQKINTDLCLSCPSLLLVNDLLSDSYPNTYVYHFGFNPANPHLAGHGADIPLVFGMPFYVWPFDSTLAGIMIDYLSSFIIDGVPESDGNIFWPTYKNGSKSILFDTTISVDTNVNTAECSFWYNYAQASPRNVLKMAEYCYLNPNLK